MNSIVISTSRACHSYNVFVCLQEGAGHAVLSAYVEIVFDNSDSRFPVSLDTLSELAIHAPPCLLLTAHCMPGGPRRSTSAENYWTQEG